DFIVLVEDAVHGAGGAEEDAVVEERGIDFGGRFIDEALGMKGAENLGTLRGWKSSRRRYRRRGGWGLTGPPPAVERGPREAQGTTCDGSSYRGRELLGSHHQSFSSSAGLFRGIPRLSGTFFWTSIIVAAWRRRGSSLRF